MTSFPPSSDPSRSLSSPRLGYRLLALGGIIAPLLVSLGMTNGLLFERLERRAEAVREIESSWGGRQVVIGPVLRVPVAKERVQTVRKIVEGLPVVTEERVREEGVVWILPDVLEADFSTATETRYRGIYEASVYRAEGFLVSNFHYDPADFHDWPIVRWEETSLVFSLHDRRSLQTVPKAWIDGEPVAVAPASAAVAWDNALAIPVAGLAEGRTGRIESRLELAFLGSRALTVASVGQINQLSMAGNWAHPSFLGPPLPSVRAVTEDGFTATWETTEFIRALPRRHVSTDEASHPARKLGAATMGVALIEPVDAYRIVERSLKYGVLFIAVVFAVFLLFEILGGHRLHPMQYFFVGAALALFFLGFLALSEIWGPLAGYTVAAVAIIGMVSIYAASILRGGKRAWALGGGLLLGYAYLYFVLQAESYALIAGVLALFALLGGAMWVTRRIDWYALSAKLASPTRPR